MAPSASSSAAKAAPGAAIAANATVPARTATVRRRRVTGAGREFRIVRAQVFDRSALDLAGGVAGDEILQSRGAGETDALGDVGVGIRDREQAPAVDQARRHHEVDVIAVDKRQQPGGRRLDQPVVGKRAVVAWPVVQRLERDAEGCGEGGHIGLLADGAPRRSGRGRRPTAGLGGAQLGQRDARRAAAGGGRSRFRGNGGVWRRTGGGRAGAAAWRSCGSAGTIDGAAVAAVQSSPTARSMTAPPPSRYAIAAPRPTIDADPSRRFVYKRPSDVSCTCPGIVIPIIAMNNGARSPLRMPGRVAVGRGVRADDDARRRAPRRPSHSWPRRLPTPSRSRASGIRGGGRSGPTCRASR